jgi:hypothetical protein
VTNQPRIDVSSLVAIDVHVHLEAMDDATATDAAAKNYFGESGAAGIREPLRNITAHEKLFSLFSRWTNG